MSKHTPGPWVILPRELHDGQWVVPIETADGWQIAEAEEGNEHLIAAAPDMLDMLEQIEKAYLGAVWSPYGTGDFIDHDGLKAVIAKAKGEA